MRKECVLNFARLFTNACGPLNYYLNSISSNYRRIVLVYRGICDCSEHRYWWFSSSCRRSTVGGVVPAAVEGRGEAAGLAGDRHRVRLDQDRWDHVRFRIIEWIFTIFITTLHSSFQLSRLVWPNLILYYNYFKLISLESVILLIKKI